MVSREKQLSTVTTSEGVNTDMECQNSEEILEYDIMWGSESKFILDEVVRGEGDDIDGWPRTGRCHRWVKVAAAREWGEREKEELQEVMEAYTDFSIKSGARAKGEIFIRHVEWEGVMVDIRESIHESPSLIVTGWRKRGKNKTKGERWEESERDMEETILTRRSKDVARFRWTSQKKLSGGESGTHEGESDMGIMDSTNTIMQELHKLLIWLQPMGA